ncbi:AfsR/SARP family transcriptional regulator [Nonomuraea phyllanthi]|uniref:AfsR/SARP family transcriptional regulator n=1 Tax=Nonomuraea phyllanthi TaxID=2219224 RepID=UPI00186ABC18|nr:BTAD domain-containing putative transcriptional regulator [Nonomuraea phyllanthi]
MDFAILGPVHVTDAGRPVRLAAKPRAVLSVLLLHPDAIVSRDRLIASVWDEPPRSALANLQNYVSVLRRAGIEVERQGPGYRLRPEPDRLDLLAFDAAVRRARLESARGDLAKAHRLFARALSLWRGRPAEDVPLAGVVNARITELEERRESARLGWIDVRLRFGLYDELVGELTPLVETAPLSERLWHRLMVALHRAGRRAEALEAYRRARSVLVAELGVEPGQELRALHEAILNDAPVEPPVLSGPIPPDGASTGWSAPMPAGPDEHARSEPCATCATSATSAPSRDSGTSGPSAGCGEASAQETVVEGASALEAAAGGASALGTAAAEGASALGPAAEGASAQETAAGGASAAGERPPGVPRQAGAAAQAETERRERAWQGVCLLPADIADFVGREPETRDMIAALRRPPERGGTAPVIVAVSGPPGVGKSTLAVHAAHLVRDHYPDGQLFVRLGGASPSPRDPADLLAELLRALGVDTAVMPASTEEQAAMYRARLADRAVLVVLDDAAGEAQVAPLIPGTPRSAVVVTSRGPLPTLPGAVALTLDVPPPEDARHLLAGVAGADRVESDPESAEAILRACGRLPLALRIAGARLVTRPAWPLAEFARRLTDTSACLNELHSGPLDVRTTFAMSYATLSAPAGRAFRLLGSVAADSVAAWAVAALAGTTAHDVDRALEELAAAGLITASDVDAAAQPRYRMHDLLRSFASELFAAEEDDERREALRRVAAEARDRVTGAARELPLAFAPPPPGVPARTPPSPWDGAWLSAERGLLVAVVVAAARAGLVTASAGLAHALAPFLIVRGYHEDAVSMLDVAIGAAAAAGDDPNETRLRLLRADAEVDRRRAHTVAAEFRRLLERCERADDLHSSAYALLGVASTLEDDLGSALTAATQAAGLFLVLGDTHGLLNAWSEVSAIQLYLGRYDDAAMICRRALPLAEGESMVHRACFLRTLGIACFETGRIEEAVGHYRLSLDLSRELRWHDGERMALRRLAEAEGALGRFDRAARMLAECTEMFARAGDVRGEALSVYAMGEVCRWRGNERAALDHFTACDALLSPRSEHVWSARTREQIARSRAALGL